MAFTRAIPSLTETLTGMRAELHRFCARMVGSVADGEDVVQDAMTRAVAAAAEMPAAPRDPRAWLFGIAKHAAIDHHRRQAMRTTDELDPETASDDPSAADALAHDHAMQFAIARFIELSAMQRACVIAKDVLGFSNDEIAEMLEQSVAAVKSALHRGRVRLRALAVEPDPSCPPHDPTIVRYTDLLNRRDVDGLRALLAGEVHLDVVGGRPTLGTYFANYAHGTSVAVPAWLDGREVLAMYARAGDSAPAYFVELTVADGAITKIRDFVHVPYIAAEAKFHY